MCVERDHASIAALSAAWASRWVTGVVNAVAPAPRMRSRSRSGSRPSINVVRARTAGGRAGAGPGRWSHQMRPADVRNVWKNPRAAPKCRSAPEKPSTRRSEPGMIGVQAPINSGLTSRAFWLEVSTRLTASTAEPCSLTSGGLDGSADAARCGPETANPKPRSAAVRSRSVSKLVVRMPFTHRRSARATSAMWFSLASATSTALRISTNVAPAKRETIRSANCCVDSAASSRSVCTRGARSGKPSRKRSPRAAAAAA